jgi:uncharacterized protein
MRPQILLASGFFFDFTNPEAGPYIVEDIAGALAKLCRFTGQCEGFYSVAQHSVAVSHLVPPHLARHALLHDASEFVLGDMSSPLKQLFPEYKALQRRVDAALWAAFGLESLEPREVKAADLVMLANEREQLLPPSRDWEILEGVKADPRVHLWPMDWVASRAQFLARFRELWPE